MPALTGDITTTAGAVATTLATVNSNTGSFGSASSIPAITVNAKGLITAVSTNAAITATPRVSTVASGASIAVSVASFDVVQQVNTTAAGTLTISAPTGSPTDGQKLIYRIQCTNAQTFSWDVIFQGSTDVALPTATTGSSKWDMLGFIYNTTNTKWQLVAKVAGF